MRIVDSLSSNKNRVCRDGAIWAFILLVLATMFPKPAMSQVLYGSLVGNVTDASDAPVPGAPVKITHVETNESRTGVTNTKELHNA